MTSRWQRSDTATTVGVILLVTIAAAGATAVMAFSGMEPEAALLICLAILVAAVIWLLTDLGGRSPTTRGVAMRLAPPPLPRVDHRLMTLRNGIAYGRAADASIDRLRTTLVDLADDQLLTQFDVERSQDPEAAAAIAGPALASFLTDADLARRLTNPRYVDQIVTAIERLAAGPDPGDPWTTPRLPKTPH